MKQAIASISRGEAHVAQGEIDAAIEDFTKAVEQCSDFGPAYYGRALAYERKGYRRAAVEDFTKAISCDDPQDRPHREEVARFITDLDPRAALACDPATLYRARARLYEKMNDKASAEADFARAKELEREPRTEEPQGG